MADAFLYKGFAIEYNVDTLKLTIEGQPVLVDRSAGGFSAPASGVEAATLLNLARAVIDALPEQKKRAEAREQHLSVLAQGVSRWNEWRREKADVSPILYDAEIAHIFQVGVEPINFSNTDLRCAKLQHAHLVDANFHQANLAHADLSHANLSGANFCRTDLYETNLSEAKLIRANLQGTQLAKTDFTGADVIECQLYGLSAWDLVMDGTTQRDLIIRSRYRADDNQEYETKMIVDDLQVAQFIHLLLNNKNIRTVIDTIGRRGVLILGRFTADRKPVLEAVREELRKHGYVPMLFDFDKPTQRDFTETIQTLAGMSLFIVADISNPRSAPLELQATMPNYMVPFVPIIDDREKPFAMFRDLATKYRGWVLDVLTYDSVDTLRRVFDPAIIQPAIALSKHLVGKRAEELRTRRAADYL
jgi:hypothetical protein